LLSDISPSITILFLYQNNFTIPLLQGLARRFFTPSQSSLFSVSKHFYHTQARGMKVIVVPALSDNFSYLVVDKSTGNAFAVDPVAPDSMLEAAKKENATITHVLTTHHHSDHAGGNKDMAEKVHGVKVLGGDDRIPAMTQKVGNGDHVAIGNIKVDVFFTPCHTSGHVLYLAKQDGEEAIFTGDTLFVAGCGRFFEGNAQQMHHALNTVIAALPDATKVYCGHEYTKKNLEFALTVDPNNAAVKQKLQWAEAQLKKGEHTVPSTIGEEKKTNPFMRVVDPDFVKSLKQEDHIAAMDHLRNLKNNF